MALTTSIALGAFALAPAAQAVSPEAESRPTTASSNIAANHTTCAVVVGAQGGLNVRAEPNTDSTIIGGLRNGQRVYVEPGSNLNSWVALAGPAEGYVFGEYLQSC
ncbi:MAG: SH3 domain-containing protein [Spirulinaceae cyanobacterium]